MFPCSKPLNKKQRNIESSAYPVHTSALIKKKENKNRAHHAWSPHRGHGSEKPRARARCTVAQRPRFTITSRCGRPRGVYALFRAPRQVRGLELDFFLHARARCISDAPSLVILLHVVFICACGRIDGDNFFFSSWNGNFIWWRFSASVLEFTNGDKFVIGSRSVVGFYWSRVILGGEFSDEKWAFGGCVKSVYGAEGYFFRADLSFNKIRFEVWFASFCWHIAGWGLITYCHYENVGKYLLGVKIKMRRFIKKNNSERRLVEWWTLEHRSYSVGKVVAAWAFTRRFIRNSCTKMIKKSLFSKIWFSTPFLRIWNVIASLFPTQ